jgi:hypothetical protein
MTISRSVWFLLGTTHESILALLDCASELHVNRKVQEGEFLRVISGVECGLYHLFSMSCVTFAIRRKQSSNMCRLVLFISGAYMSHLNSVIGLFGPFAKGLARYVIHLL